MSRTIHSRIYPLTLCCTLIVASAWAAEYREWKDSTGRHTIEARFIEQQGESVILQTRQGKRLTIELSRLSKEDQQHVAGLGDENPFRELTDEPSGGMAPAAAAGPATDWSTAEEIEIVGGDRWEVPIPESPGLGFEPKQVPLPKKQHFFENMQPLAVNPLCKRAAIGYVTSFSVPTPITRVVLADIAGGRMVASEPVEANMRPMALLNDGATIVMTGFEDKGEGADHLQFWRLNGKAVVRGPLWKPYADDENAQNVSRRPGSAVTKETKIAFAESVDESTLLTCSAVGHLVAWNPSSRQPIWHMRLGAAPSPAWSADRQLMVFAQSKQFLVVRTTDGEILGQASLADKGNLSWLSFALSPSGKLLGVSSWDRLLLFDLEKKEWVGDMNFPGLQGAHALAFPDEEYVLIDGKILIHWPSRIRLWEYSGASTAATIGQYTFFGLTSDAGGLLYPTELPHAEAVSMLESARERSDIFIIRPGVPLAIDVSGVKSQHQAAVRESLELAISKIGCQVAPQAEVQVVATVTGPKQEAAAYHMSGAHVVQKYVSKVALRYANNEIWSSSGTNIPGMIMLSRGETLEQYLAKASKAPNLSFFKTVALPNYLQKPAGGAQGQSKQQMTIGVSKLTINGFE